MYWKHTYDRHRLAAGDLVELKSGEVVQVAELDALVHGDRAWFATGSIPSSISVSPNCMWLAWDARHGLVSGPHNFLPMTSSLGVLALVARGGRPFSTVAVPPVDAKRAIPEFPHACPRCGARAYVGLFEVTHASPTTCRARAG